MLKFIIDELEQSDKEDDFKTSHVKVYPERSETTTRRDSYFKTSHVKVYRGLSAISGFFSNDFKTSHVKVYLNAFRAERRCNLISKHLMLKFILAEIMAKTFVD